MTATIQTILFLLAVLVVVAVAARRLNTAPSILLVAAGIGLALIPGLPRIELAPELVLLGILPPLIYAAGVAMSWREFRFNLRPITLLAFGCVVFTSGAVALVVPFLLGMPLALGFVLGAIVAPTDAVAPLAIVRNLGLPRRLIVVLEGEGLANDATALVVYRFAVAAGLYVSWNGALLIPAATRLQGIFFWDLLVYLLEGMVFLVTGMETRALLEHMDAALLRELAIAVPLTVAVIVIARFVWVYPATYLPRWLSPALARRDPQPPWQWIFLLAFVGVRGVVSLGAALAIPLTTAAGAPFPRRDLILFVTFGVIVVTLIGQGLMLPAVVRWLALPHDAEDERRREQDAEIAARLQALRVTQGRLDGLAAAGETAPEVVALLRTRNDHRAGQVPRDADAHEAIAAAVELRADL